MSVIVNPPAPFNQHARNTYGPIVAGTTGATGAHTLFTVTGKIILRALTVATTDDLTSGGAATLDFGVTGDPNALVAPGPIAYSDFVTTKLLGTSATATGAAAVIGGYVVAAHIIMTINDATVTGGTLVIDAYYDAVTDNGALS